MLLYDELILWFSAMQTNISFLFFGFFFFPSFFFVAKHYDLPKNIQRSFSGKLHNLLTVSLFLVAQYDLWTEFKVI